MPHAGARLPPSNTNTNTDTNTGTRPGPGTGSVRPGRSAPFIILPLVLHVLFPLVSLLLYRFFSEVFFCQCLLLCPGGGDLGGDLLLSLLLLGEALHGHDLLSL